jgi:glycyl-tRNA synthetase
MRRLRALPVAPFSSASAARTAAAAPPPSHAFPLDELVSWAKTRGFVYPAPLYGSIGAGYDYGPAGAALKRNLERAWWADFVDRRADCVPLETAALLSPRVWEASGHVAQFSDPLAECATCRRRVRADKAVDAARAAAAAAAAGTDAGAAPAPSAEPAAALGGSASVAALGAALAALRVACPACGAPAGARGLGAPVLVPLLCETSVGGVGGGVGGGTRTFLRPETAQGAYIHFLDIATSTRRRLPFGVGQSGSSWRNETDVGPFLFRSREFAQLELQYFCAPASSAAHYAAWVSFCVDWLRRVAGLRAESVRVKEYAPDELAHYALATTDLLYHFPHGWDELWGIANRGDYDLRAHSAASGVALAVADADGGPAVTPHVVEPALGLSRLVFAVLADGLRRETLPSGDTRIVFRVAERLAPVALTVLPLMKKDALVAAAGALLTRVLPHARADLDVPGAIGKRYRRADEMGTPLCATVDQTTLVDGTVTLRDRDSMAQVRVHADDVVARAKAGTLVPSEIVWPGAAVAAAAAQPSSASGAAT